MSKIRNIIHQSYINQQLPAKMRDVLEDIKKDCEEYEGRLLNDIGCLEQAIENKNQEIEFEGNQAQRKIDKLKKENAELREELKKEMACVDQATKAIDANRFGNKPYIVRDAHEKLKQRQNERKDL